MPEWSGDDTFVYYLSNFPRTLFRQRADFAGQAEMITNFASSFGQRLSPWTVMDVAPTSDLVLIGAQGPGRPRDIYQVDAAADRQPRPFMEGDAFYGYAKFSPDGNWLAFSIARSGQTNLYVQAFPEGEPLRVSRGEGAWPLWSPAGDEIYFWGLDGWIMAVPIQTEPELSIGEPRRLFESAGYTSGSGTEHWDIAPDGRFLMLKEHQMLPPLARVHVVINWVEELKRQVPAGR